MVRKRFTKKLKKQPKKGGDANRVTAVTRLVNNELYTVDNNNDNIFIKKENPVTEQPVTEQPVTENPVTENIPEPVIENPVTEIIPEPVIEPNPEPQNTIDVQPEEKKQDFPDKEEKQIEPEIQNTRNIDLEIGVLKDTINKKQNKLKNVIIDLKVVKNRIALNEKSLNNYSSKNRITRKLKNIFYDKYANEKINIKKEIQMLKQDMINYENEKIQIENEIQTLENKINEKENEKIKENQTQIDDDDDDMFNDISKAGRRTRRKKSKKVQKKSLKKLPKKTKTKK